MMIRRVHTHRQRQARAIHDRHDFHAFSAFRVADPQTATAAVRECCIDLKRGGVASLFLAQIICKIDQNPAQNLLLCPRLKPPMDGLLARV